MISRVDRCEVVEVRSLADAEGYACSQQATFRQLRRRCDLMFAEVRRIA